jgi:hypothetical protein
MILNYGGHRFRQFPSQQAPSSGAFLFASKCSLVDGLCRRGPNALVIILPTLSGREHYRVLDVWFLKEYGCL